MTTAARTARLTADGPGTAARWPPAIWALLAGTLVIRALGFAYPFLSYRAAELGFTPAGVGRVLAVWGVGMLVGTLLCGWLADRIGRRRALVGAMLVAAVAFPLLAGAESVAGVLVLVLLAGVCYDAPRPIVSAVVADVIVTESGRARVNSARHLAVGGLGPALAGGAAGLLAPRVGLQALFWIHGAACLFFAVLGLLFMDYGPSPASRRSVPGLRGGYRAALADRRLWLLSVASLCALTCASGIYSAVPILMASDGLDAAAFGWVQVANGAAVVAVTPALTPWLARRAAHPKPMLGPLAASSAVLGAGMGIAGIVSTTAGYSVAVVLVVPGEIGLIVAASDVLTRMSPAHARGLYAGIWGSSLAVSVIVSPLLASWALSAGGDVLVAVTTVSSGLLGAVLCWPLRARPHPDGTSTPVLEPTTATSALPGPFGKQ
ncbi:MFS transporter [Streptomyces sp. NPDC056672]|uniref:MFS transporter n=1 Tax=Streptomyces sp. NPDC056672 TaxID=3345906 RepID=UPI0036D0081E